MTVTVRPSADGDRVWLDVDGAPRGFIRMRALEELCSLGADWPPQELVAVIRRSANRRRVTDRRGK